MDLGTTKQVYLEETEIVVNITNPISHFRGEGAKKRVCFVFVNEQQRRWR